MSVKQLLQLVILIFILYRLQSPTISFPKAAAHRASNLKPVLYLILVPIP